MPRRKMKTALTFLLLLGLIDLGFAQNVPDLDFGYYKSLNVGVGYSYSFADPYEKNFHLLDIGINQSNYGGMHGAGYQYGIGTELGLNTESFILGPKISGILYYQFIALGTELVTYTDFDQFTLRLVPFFGIGADVFRLTLNPHVILINSDFKPINNGLVNLTVNLSLRRERVD